MNIDFAPPSSGTYNNTGSSRQLVSYLEHEDIERIKEGLSLEEFFNLYNNDVLNFEVIADIDSNVGQLGKTDAKFYAIHISPSEQELQQMGKTPNEQSQAMKRYVREVFIPAYAANFNKGLTAEDIKFYGKIHHERERSTKASWMHCHIIVSRKDNANKKKLSPLTNHRNTQSGTVKGGFDRTNLFKTVEKGFDELFSYNRSLKETFEYCNTMKNGNISEKLQMQSQERDIKPTITLQQSVERENIIDNQIFDNSQSVDIIGNLIPDITIHSSISSSSIPEEIPDGVKKKKKKEKKRGFRL